MKKALFFDIDGTLVSFQTHRIPASTVGALEQAKAEGHRVFIATGRPPIIITNLGQIEHLIDGYVTINGALSFVGDEVVACHHIAAENARRVADDARENGYGLIMVGEHDLAILDPTGAVDRIFKHELAVKNLDKAKSMEEVLTQRIMQMTAFVKAGAEEDALMALIPDCVSGRWHPEFTDITVSGADKGHGIREMAAYLGLDIQQTIAFGDGGNDITMIETAGVGVAMGNAVDSLKAVADVVTTSVDEDGVAKALGNLIV